MARSSARNTRRPWPVARPGPSCMGDRKSTRLNSSHSQISYAVFCLKKKKNDNRNSRSQQLSTKLINMRKRNIPHLFDITTTETLTSILMITLILDSHGQFSHTHNIT